MDKKLTPHTHVDWITSTADQELHIAQANAADSVTMTVWVERQDKHR